jgi:hypothetical protein
MRQRGEPDAFVLASWMRQRPGPLRLASGMHSSWRAGCVSFRVPSPHFSRRVDQDRATSDVGRKLENLSVLRKRGFATNRRLLDVQKTSQDVAMSEALLREVTGPRSVDNQRASALKFGGPLVLALFSVLVLFRLLPGGFRSRGLREHLAPRLGDDPSQWTQGRLTYQLRRLRLHGLIARIEGTQRYQVTQRGYRTALWFTRCHARRLRPALAEILTDNASRQHRAAA